MQTGSQNTRQDDFDPDSMTYEVGHATCMNLLLISSSTSEALYLKIMKVSFPVDSFLKSVFIFRNCNHLENLSEARAGDLQRTSSHDYQHSNTNLTNLACSQGKRKKQKSMASLACISMHSCSAFVFFFFLCNETSRPLLWRGKLMFNFFNALTIWKTHTAGV